jgi:hypothetical protein
MSLRFITHHLLHLIVTFIFCPVAFSAPPTGSYLHFGRPEHCGGIHLGDGEGLPKGNFTMSYWAKPEGQYEKRILLDGDYKFDSWPMSAFPEGYSLYWNFGGLGINSGR